jgi:hypothetical protein
MLKLRFFLHVAVGVWSLFSVGVWLLLQ